MLNRRVLESNLREVSVRIRAAEQKYGRIPGSVRLLAVSKTQTPEAIAMLIGLGQKAYGENYLQEARVKIEALTQYDVEWHFIGAVQSNKTKLIAENFSWVHSIDRVAVASRLAKHRPGGLPDLNVCIQVNIDDEPGKAGAALNVIPELAYEISSASRLCLRGLMAIPKPADNFVAQRQVFARLHKQFLALQETYPVDTLSMGMSGDFEAAIAEGATMVRLGTSIFGPRQHKKAMS